MISLTIDPSVFALPPKEKDLEVEYKNIVRFLSKINILQKLEKCNTVTVSYMNKIPDYLQLDGWYPNDMHDLDFRIRKLLNSNLKFELNTEAVLDFYKSTIAKQFGKKKYSGIKGKIGVYENIPDKNNDPNKKYKNISYDKTLYPSKLEKVLFLFETYLGYIAELNQRYFSMDVNYIVTSGKTRVPLEITMFYDKAQVSHVNIVNIQKAMELCRGNTHGNIESTFIELQNTADNINYSKIITISEIKKKMGLARSTNSDIRKNTAVSEADFSTKLYSYIKTLDDIANVIIKNDMKFKNIQDLVVLVNAYGCLCSQDGKHYAKCPIKARHFGEEDPFSLHLKPITYDIRDELSDLTRRIYFKWLGKEKKFFIGWVGEHPLTCTNDKDSDCIKIKCPYNVALKG